MIADAELTPRPAIDRLALGGALVGVGALVVGLMVAPTRTWANLLLNGFYFVSLSLGALVFLSTQYLTKAGWSTAIRRVPEGLAAYLPIGALLILPVWFGRHQLYEWMEPGAAEGDALLAAKAPYLNEPFFLVRMVVILAVWAGFAYLFRRASLAQDASGNGEAQRARLTRLSAIFLVVFAVTVSIASFDWLMSVEPHWFSTIYGVYVFSGLFVAAIAAVTVGVLVLGQEGGPLERAVSEEHLHDLGKMIFAFSTFWAYIWVSQYLLIWYGNIPEEATYFALRTGEGWLPVFALNVILNWGVPFLVLMSRNAKRNPRVLLAVAAVVLVGHWLDLYLLVMPPLLPGFAIGLIEVLTFVGFAGLFLAVVRWALQGATLVPKEDPLLGESLSYHAEQ